MVIMFVFTFVFSLYCILLDALGQISIPSCSVCLHFFGFFSASVCVLQISSEVHKFFFFILVFSCSSSAPSVYRMIGYCEFVHFQDMSCVYAQQQLLL